VTEEAACRAVLPALAGGASLLGVPLSPAQAEQFVRYCALLHEANQRINLTGVRDAEGILRTLFLDSLTLFAALPDCFRAANDLRVVDVGSGAGLPGIPLGIIRSEWSITLVESIGKKARFLLDTVTTLGLRHLEVVAQRAELTAAEGRRRDSYDLCTARAVAKLPTLIELCAPLVRPGGLMAFPKSGRVVDEVQSACQAALALRVEYLDMVAVPAALGLGEARYTVLYRKQEPTPAAYPRRVGLAVSRPIIDEQRGTVGTDQPKQSPRLSLNTST
jgi:16S rRNA (guanine527-N7)-methyltransferase